MFPTHLIQMIILSPSCTGLDFYFFFFSIANFSILRQIKVFFSYLILSYQKDSNGSASEKSRQDIGPVVAIFSHPDHADDHRQAQQGEADGGLCQTRPFGLEHQRHIHLKKGT